MRRILSIAYRDFLNSIKSSIVLYMMIAPLILAIIVSLFVPTAESSTVVFAVDTTVDSKVKDHILKYASIESFNDLDALKERVMAIDDVVGITQTNGHFGILSQGNESSDLDQMIKMILYEYHADDNALTPTVNVVFSDIGHTDSPVSVIGTISVVMMCIAIAGMIVGLNIVEEKEAQTIRALNVTPMNTLEFIVGKSLVGSVISLIQVFIVMWIMGYTQIHWVMLFTFTLVNLLIVILFGFLTGLSSPNQMAAIANIKILFLPISLSVIGAVLLPASKHFFVYWSPFYWTYVGFLEIIKQTASWLSLSQYSLWILLITLLLFVALRKQIRTRLN